MTLSTFPPPPAVDTESDPRAPKLHKVAEPEDIQAATGKLRRRMTKHLRNVALLLHAHRLRMIS